MAEEDGLAVALRLVAHIQDDAMLHGDDGRADGQFEIQTWVTAQGRALEGELAKQLWAVAKTLADGVVALEGQVA